MILYHPIEGGIYMKKVKIRPKTCFLMTQLGNPIPDQVSRIRKTLKKYLNQANINIIDANSVRTGRDFLIKIWEMIVSVPLGVAIITEELSSETMANIFYEMGILQTLGKETLIIKSKNCNIPSDFVRTEYIEYDRKFKFEINKYLKTFSNQADHYFKLGSQLNKNPIVTIDYLKRAYLVTGDENIKRKINNNIKNFLDLTNFDEDTKKNIRNLFKL